jgi:hydroxymethylpyrimidine/phosphomethylpyrimidine kinase
MSVVLEDIGADAIKTGMLHDAPMIEAVAETLAAKAAGLPLVLDPVMTAKGGTDLLARQALDALKQHLIPRAAILTPNLIEAERLTGLSIADPAAMRIAAEKLIALGARAVLVKGGHLPGDHLVDLFLDQGGEVVTFEGERIATRHSHGTGCTLASAIATGLAQGLAPVPAIRRARAFLVETLRNAPGLGHGHGPLGHGFAVKVPE